LVAPVSRLQYLEDTVSDMRSELNYLEWLVLFGIIVGAVVIATWGLS